MTSATDITSLQARIEYLEDNRRYIQNALETVLSLGDFHATNEEKSNDVDFLLEQAGNKICSIIPFSTWAFYLVDEDNFLFNMAYCDPPQIRSVIENEVDAMIDQGMFAWAVREKRGVIIPSQNQSEQYLLHVIASGGRIRGMFLGTLPQKKGSLADTSVTLLSIILLRVANALENLEFCIFLENKKEILEKQVAARTEALTRSEARLKQSMEEAKQLAIEAKNASAAKSDFLAKMSHELRTPLNGIIGMVEVALSTELDENQRQILQIVDRESFALLKIINDILDFSKVEAGKLEIEQVPFDLGMLFKEVHETIVPQASKKGLRLNTRIDPHIQSQLIGDPYRLKQVLLNLAGNALKFTDHGDISLIGEIVSDASNIVEIKLTVKDTGIGIPTDKQSTIFEGFSQADESTTRKYGGTGLGITISQQLVDLLGGCLALESKENQGTTFYFSIPFEKAIANNSARESRPNKNNALEKSFCNAPFKDIQESIKIANGNIRILLVDDYPTNRKVASMHLSSVGYSVDIVENGAKAVDAFQEQKYDLILMDIQMPVMDGYEATRRIREWEANPQFTAHRVPIIAMTAHAYQNDMDVCLSSGMDGFITKPIRKNELLEIVAQWILNTHQQCLPNITPTVSRTTTEPMDLPTAIAEFGDESVVMEVAHQLVQNIGKQIDMMSEAVIQKDFETLQRESHKIKGGAGTMEAHHLAALAKKIEDLSRHHDNIAVASVLDEFKTEFIRLKTFVESIKIQTP